MKWRLYRSVEIQEQADSHKIFKTPLKMGAGDEGYGARAGAGGLGPGPVISNSLIYSTFSCYILRKNKLKL